MLDLYQTPSASQNATASHPPAGHRNFRVEDLGRDAKLFLLLSVIIFANYAWTWARFHVSFHGNGSRKIPATVPYLLPLIGSTVNLIWDPRRFFRSSTFYNGEHAPVRVKGLGFEIYLLQGRQNIVSLFKVTNAFTPTYMHLLFVKNVCGMRSKPLSVRAADDSGDRPEPAPGILVEPRNRIGFLVHEGLVKFFSGSSQSRLLRRFTSSLSNRLTVLDVSPAWTEIPDFLDFIQVELGTSLLEAITGPQLMIHNPTFIRDFFEYDTNAATLGSGIPRLLAPRAYKSRDKVLSMIKRWHLHAQENFDENLIAPDGDFDPYWGSEHIRYRQKIFRNVEGYDADAIASSDLGLLIAMLHNAVLATFWAIVHIYQDTKLLSQIRNELRSSVGHIPNHSQPNVTGESLTSEHETTEAISELSLHTDFDMDSLLQKPILQSVYAETLRLYIHGYLVRHSERSDLTANDWYFPKKSLIVVSTDAAHSDSQVWNTQNGRHPVDTFWAGRFLAPQGANDKCLMNNVPVAKKKELESPLEQPREARTIDQTDDKDAERPAKFTMHGLNGAWIPYGGGPRKCPGRHYAKRQILLTCAKFLAAFDIEILADDKCLRLKGGEYGFGAQRPVGKIPARIRRAR